MFRPKLNYQPGPRNENALQMLRDKELKKYTKVKTSDDSSLGDALQLHLRLDNIDPDLKLYAAYLEVYSPQLGTRYYVPTDFVADYDPEEGVLTLSVTLKTAQSELWDRERSFIAGHLGQIEKLA